jgi:hypothetical protein
MQPAIRWGLGLGALALAGSLLVWAIHMPNEPVKIVPLSPPALHERDPAPAEEASGETEEDAPQAVSSAQLPEQLNRRQLEKGMDDVKPLVQRCRGLEPPFSGIVRVRVTISRSGSVQSAVISPPAAGTPTGDCVVKAVKRAVFPRYRGTLAAITELSWPFWFAPPGGLPAEPTTTSAVPAR